MHAATMQEKARVVQCRACGKSIRLTAVLLKRESAVLNDEQGSEFTSRVFSARCRKCHTEAIYALHEIVDEN